MKAWRPTTTSAGLRSASTGGGAVAHGRTGLPRRRPGRVFLAGELGSGGRRRRGRRTIPGRRADDIDRRNRLKCRGRSLKRFERPPTCARGAGAFLSGRAGPRSSILSHPRKPFPPLSARIGTSGADGGVFPSGGRWPGRRRPSAGADGGVPRTGPPPDVRNEPGRGPDGGVSSNRAGRGPGRLPRNRAAVVAPHVRGGGATGCRGSEAGTRRRSNRCRRQNTLRGGRRVRGNGRSCRDTPRGTLQGHLLASHCWRTSDKPKALAAPDPGRSPACRSASCVPGADVRVPRLPRSGDVRAVRVPVVAAEAFRGARGSRDRSRRRPGRAPRGRRHLGARGRRRHLERLDREPPRR